MLSINALVRRCNRCGNSGHLRVTNRLCPLFKPRECSKISRNIESNRFFCAGRNENFIEDILIGPDFKDCRHSCGEFDNICFYCGALFFKHEKKQGGSLTSSFCCAEGKIVLPSCPGIHKYIAKFLTSSDKKSVEFRRNIRAYNTALSFTHSE